MQKYRVALTVEVDIDPVPGWGDNADDWQRHVQRFMDESVSHYNPVVTIAGVTATNVRGI